MLMASGRAARTPISPPTTLHTSLHDWGLSAITSVQGGKRFRFDFNYRF